MSGSSAREPPPFASDYATVWLSASPLQIDNVSVYLPVRVRRLAHALADDLAAEVVEPMLRCASYDEASAVLTRGLVTSSLVRKALSALLWSEAERNDVLREAIMGAPRAWIDVDGRAATALSKDSLAQLERSLDTLEKATREMIPLLEWHIREGRWIPVHFFAAIEPLATRTELLTLTLGSALSSKARASGPAWLGELVSDLVSSIERYASLTREWRMPGEESVAGPPTDLQEILSRLDVVDPAVVAAVLRQDPKAASALSATLPLLERHFPSKKPQLRVREGELVIEAFTPGPAGAIAKATLAFDAQWLSLDARPSDQLVVRVKELR